MYLISCYWVHSEEQKCYWEPSEEQRWLEHQAGYYVDYLESESASSTGASSPAIDTNPPYKKAEKRFLESNWDDEFTFLINHGLDIYEDEDREKGRLILRELMHEEGLDGESANEEESDDEEESDADFWDRAEFTSEQLEWIETHYDNIDAFMRSYGMCCMDYFRCIDAKEIVDAFLSEEQLSHATNV